MKFKLIKQQDDKDCGAACLAMVLKHYKSDIPISKLRELSGTDNEGTSVLGLKKCIEKFNFECIASKFDSHIWAEKDLVFPLIAHCLIDQQYLHYVIIYKIKGNILYIADPSKGLLKKTTTEFEKQWSGILMLMSPNSHYEVQHEDLNGKNSYLKILLQQKKIIFLTVLLSFIITLFGIIGSYYFQGIIDFFIPKRAISKFNIISIGLIFIYLIQTVFEYTQGYLLVLLGQRMSVSVMLRYYKHVLKLPLSFYETRKSGEIVSRFLDANKIIDALASATLSIFIDLGMVIFVGLTLFTQNKYLFLVALITIPFYTLIIFLGIKPLNRLNEEEMFANAAVNSSIIESINGIETIKAYNAEAEIYNKVEKQFTNFMTKNLKRNNLDNIQTATKHAIQLISTLLILWIGSYYVMDNIISLGQLITFNALLIFFMNPLQNIINLQTKIQTAQVANRRINEVFYIDSENKGEINKKNANISILKNKLVITDVSFSYGMKHKALKKITTSIAYGEKVTLIGVSGSGKSTLAKMLVNFYSPTIGTIIYDDVNMKNIDVDILRTHVTYVPQESFFFHGTILENLNFGTTSACSFNRVVEVCEQTLLMEYISSLPLKFDTLIEEGGSNLSGGQKQRLALARALLKNSEFLILDEATSGLDPLLEYNIIQNLNKLTSKTILFISHHLSIAKTSDKVLVLNQGELIEQGTHQELRYQGGLYQKLWEIGN